MKKVHDKQVDLQLFRMLAEKAPYGIQYSDPSGTILYSNPAHHRMQGYKPYELIGKSIFNLSADKEMKAKAIAFYRDIISRRQVPTSRIARDRRKDGAFIDVRIDWDYVDDEAGNVAGIVSIITDITEELHRERELERSRKRNRALLEALPDLMYVFDREGRYIEYYTNNKALYYRNPDDIAGKLMSDVLPYDLAQRLVEMIEKSLDSGDLQHIEYLLPIDGAERYFESRFVPYDRENQLVLSIVREITEEIMAEEALKQAVEEKSFLMKELNHRVKNNLILVSSLISLRNASINNQALEDIQHQVDTIRIVHEKLMDHGCYSKIELREYLSDILDPIFAFSSLDVKISFTMKKISIPVQKAVPLGLIINELATNAIKHGFDAGCEVPPLFSIAIEHLKEEELCRVVVFNSGKDFPAEIDPSSAKSLGLQLVTSLVAQLEGTVQIKGGGGTSVIMEFPALDCD